MCVYHLREKVLSDYKETCQEVNKLYLAAHQLIKTIEVARTSMLAGDDNTALLNYNMVAEMLKDPKQVAICYNNIGCIHLRLKAYDKHYIYSQKAISIVERELRTLLPTHVNFNVCFGCSLIGI